MSGKTVYSELKSYAFDTPAKAPTPGNLIPSSFAQFFGRKYSREPPTLDLDEFAEQFHQIEIYGVYECEQSFSPIPIFYCTSSNYEQNILKADCSIVPTTADEEKKFMFTSKAVIRLTNALEQKTIEFAEDSMIQCHLEYDQHDT